ncbi:MAG TPA: bifunctional riboflavin kinase/FAD synthetase [Candidatus Acidoferrales bacterium]|nr:bifunctional riboflavin kinase/FAD synthetase [Candidatus Acidoferrales bacterium]
MPLEVLHSPSEWKARFGPRGTGSVLTVGNFDGLHLGHQRILHDVVERARSRNAVSTVVTFDPPPLKLLRPEAAPPRISTLTQRLEGFRHAGLDAALVVHFDAAFAKVSAEDFIRKILLDQVGMRAILVGENFRFGHRHLGDTRLLAELGRAQGFNVEIVPPMLCRGEIVSSTAIRREVAEGRVSRAARLLGRPFVLTGEIRRGTGMGNKFVFPTLNLAPEQELLPGQGVYVTETTVEGRLWRSATNVGRRPTFNGASLSVESHLFGFSESRTAGRMEIHFWKRLRDEKKFSGPEELRGQITLDIARAKAFFNRLERAHRAQQSA